MATRPPVNFPTPSRGEIWYVKLSTDPAEKAARPVVIISTDTRNKHPRANTVLVAPLSTTISNNPFHITLEPGETGLRERAQAQGDNITVVSKELLRATKTQLRTQNTTTLKRIAIAAVRGMGFQPEDLC